MKIKSISRKISVSKELIEASKGLLTLGVITSNVEVAKFNEELWSLLQMAGESQKKYDPNKIDGIPQIKALRDTYKTLGLKTSEYKGSNEALLKRILSDKGLYKINTVVDVNNYISVESLRSVGSYDLSQLSGDIEFRKGKAEEKYIGTTNRPVVLKNLPVLCDEKGPFGSPTSDSGRALIKDTTTDIMTVIFSFDGYEGLEEQMFKVGDLLKKYADATNVNIYSVQDKPVELIFSDEGTSYDTLIKKTLEMKIEETKEDVKEYKELTVKTLSSKEYKEDLSNYKLIDGDIKKLAIGFNNILTGEMHGDMKQLRAIEHVINLLKFRGLIKNEPTKVEGDESLGFAYGGVKLNYNPKEFGDITVEKKDLPYLNLKLCDNHFELFFSSPENNSNIDKLVEVIGTIFDSQERDDITNKEHYELKELENVEKNAFQEGLKQGQWEGKIKREISKIKMGLKYKIEPEKIKEELKILTHEKNIQKLDLNFQYIQDHIDETESQIMGGMDIDMDINN